jgi:hypothetical protein
MTEIHSLHGTTVAEIFSSGLENLEQIEAIAVSVLWKDGTVTAGCSNTTTANKDAGLGIMDRAFSNIVRMTSQY